MNVITYKFLVTIDVPADAEADRPVATSVSEAVYAGHEDVAIEVACEEIT